MAGNEPTDAGIVEVGHEAAILTERVENPCLDLVIGLDRAVPVEVGTGEVGDHDRVARHPGKRLAGEHGARHLDDGVRASTRGQAAKPGGEIVRAIEGGRHGRRAVAVEATEVGEDTDIEASLGEDRRGQPRRRRLPTRAGDRDHPHPPGRVTGQRVRQTGLRPSGVGHDAQRRPEGGDDPLGDDPRHSASNRLGGKFMAIAPSLEAGDEQIPRPAGFGGVVAPPGDDVVAGNEPGSWQDLGEPHGGQCPGLLRSAPGFPAPISTHAIGHDGLLAACAASPREFPPRSSLTAAREALSVALIWGQPRD